MKPRPPLPPGPYLVLGLARSGSAAAHLLRARGERVIGVDAGEPSGTGELAAAGVELHLGGAPGLGGASGLGGAPGLGGELGRGGGGEGEGSGEALLERARTLVKSPGVPAQDPLVAAARARGVPVLGELELAWRLLPDHDFVAVSGTNGKTTTVELIGHLYRAAGLPVAVAGNVGTALSSLVGPGRLAAGATIVCELSSFQLEDALAFAPEAAVLLNVSADHLDRHGTFEDYLAAKLGLFAHQGEGDLALLPAALRELQIGGAARRVCFEDDPYIGFASELTLPGEHNRQNAAAAAAVCLERGLDPDALRAGLRSFPGVAHRLERVAEHDGVLYVNDSKATNVASTLVALRAFAGEGTVHLILGGQGKGQDFAPLREPVAQGCRGVYLIGEDAAAIAAALEGAPLRQCGTLEAAVAAARAAARPGAVVLLSPGCASFDQFRDFEARGDLFRELVTCPV